MTDPACGLCNDQQKYPDRVVIHGCPVHDSTATAAPWWQGATDCPRPLWRLLRCRSRANGVGFRCDRHRWHRGLHHADRNGTFGSISRDVWPVAS